MPSISVHEGDSYDPHGPLAALEDESRNPKVEIVSDGPTEDEYNDAMSRHGTDDWTDEDAETQRRYNEGRKGLDPQDLRDAREDYDNGEGPRVVDLREEEPSPGNSSSKSGDSTAKSKNSSETGRQSSAPVTGSPSKKDQTGNSTVGLTGGSGKADR